MLKCPVLLVLSPGSVVENRRNSSVQEMDCQAGVQPPQACKAPMHRCSRSDLAIIICTCHRHDRSDRHQSQTFFMFHDMN